MGLFEIYLAGVLLFGGAATVNNCVIEKPTRVISKGECYTMNAIAGIAWPVAVCRPRFDKWKLKTTIVVDDELVNPDTVLDMLNDAGKRSGIGSFRVSKGGYFGQFVVTKFEELA